MADNINSYQYYAFISYSHADKKWGDWLHKSLETYRIPKHLIGQQARDEEIPERINPVFRDREELPTSSDLGTMINNALSDSRYLIVICSPHSAQSRWVNEEILSFKRLGRSNRILSIIVDGEPNASDKNTGQQECFPEALKYDLGKNGELTDIRSEPIAADARPGKDGKADAKLKLIAGVLGVGFNELKQRELQRRHRRMVAIASSALILSVVMIGLAITAFIARNEAVEQRQIAIEAKDIAQRNLATALFEKAQKAYSEKRFNEAAIFSAEAWVKDPSNYYPGIFENYDLITPLVGILEGNLTEGASGVVSYENFIYSSHYDQVIRKWDVNSLSLLKEFKGHTDKIRGIAINPNGKKLVSTSYDRTAKIWDTQTNSLNHTYDQHGARVYSVDIHPAGDFVATGDNAGEIHIWNLATGQNLQILIAHSGITVMHLGFDKTGRYLISSGTDNGDLIVWSTENWQKMPIHKTISHGIWGFDTTSNGETIIYSAGNSKGNISFKSSTSGAAIIPTVNHTEFWFRDILIAQDDNLLIATTRYGQLTFFDIKNKRWLRSVLAHDIAIRRATFASNEQLLVSAGMDGSVRMWNISKHLNEPTKGFSLSNGTINSIDLSEDKELMVTGEKNGIVRIWNMQTGKLNFEWQEEYGSSITHAEFINGTNQILVAGAGGKFITIDSKTGQLINYEYLDSDIVPHALVLADGKRVIRTSKFGVIEIFDLESNKVITKFNNNRTETHSLAVNHDQTLLATGGFDRTIDIWDLSSGKLIKSILAHNYSIRTLIFDKNNRIISGGTDGAVKLWEIDKMEPIRDFLGHTARVRTIDLSPDESLIVSGSEDNRVKVWEIKTGKLLLTYHGPSSYVGGVRFGKTNNIIYVTHFDGTIRKINLNNTKKDPAEHLQRVLKLTGLKVEGIKIVTLNRTEWEQINFP